MTILLFKRANFAPTQDRVSAHPRPNRSNPGNEKAPGLPTPVWDAPLAAMVVEVLVVHQLLLSLRRNTYPVSQVFTRESPSSGAPGADYLCPPALGQEDQVILPQGKVHLCVRGPAQSQRLGKSSVMTWQPSRHVRG